jgi:hypothetical protein
VIWKEYPNKMGCLDNFILYSLNGWLAKNYALRILVKTGQDILVQEVL